MANNKNNNANQTGIVWFVGAGPGDPDLLTVKATKLLSSAGAILFAGSLVDVAVTKYASPECEIADSKEMTLEEITNWLITRAHKNKIVVRLQTGDPSLYGALIEMSRPLDDAGINWQVVPGVSSAFAAAACAGITLTLPEVCQTVIFTRIAGRTPMPVGEDFASLAKHKTSICIFLSITLLPKVVSELINAGWEKTAPIVIVQKASWISEEKILRGTLSDICLSVRTQKITNQAMIIVSPTLCASQRSQLPTSKLYDKSFSHKFRKGIRSE